MFSRFPAPAFSFSPPFFLLFYEYNKVLVSLPRQPRFFFRSSCYISILGAGALIDLTVGFRRSRVDWIYFSFLPSSLFASLFFRSLLISSFYD